VVGKANLKTLSHLATRSHYRAEHGDAGHGGKKHGRNGHDLEIAVPPGSMVFDEDTKQLLADVVSPGQHVLIASGGRGGKGNVHYKSSTNRAPRYAQDGTPGVDLRARVQLRLIADVGLVGLPNAGKSSLLKALTNANPKVGSYAFTTRIPQLGVVQAYDRELVIADIPGIIEGASEGAGLGHRFLKHISRTAAIAVLLDLSEGPRRVDFERILAELAAFDPRLRDRTRLVLGTKLDTEGAADALETLKRELSDEEVLGVSSHSRVGLPGLRERLFSLVDTARLSRAGGSPQETP
jgi:GTP-binding protein